MQKPEAGDISCSKSGSYFGCQPLAFAQALEVFIHHEEHSFGHHLWSFDYGDNIGRDRTIELVELQRWMTSTVARAATVARDIAPTSSFHFITVIVVP